MNRILVTLESLFTEKVIHINWLNVLIFSFFWTYGVYGFFSVPSFGKVLNSIITLIFTGILIYLLYIRKNKLFFDTIIISKRDIQFGISYFFILLCVAFRDLHLPLDQDQFYHSQQAILPSIMIAKVIGSLFPFVSSIPFFILILVSTFCILFCSIGAYLFFKKKKEIYWAVFLVVLFVLFRVTTLYLGGNTSAFPTLRLFPIFVTGTLFSYSDFGFRLATFVGLIGLTVSVSSFARRYMNDKLSFLFGLFVGTIPVLFHVGTIVEASLWASVAWVTTILYVSFWTEEGRLPYVRIISIVTLCSLMRVSSFLTFLPLFLVIVFDVVAKKISYKDSAVMMSLCLVFIPVVVMGMVIGSPATYRGEVSLIPYIPPHTGILGRLSILFQSGSLYTYVYNSLHFLYIPILVLPIFLFRNAKKLILISISFISIFVLFYSVNPDLWGNGRYQAEYLVPFIILSVFFIITSFKRFEFLVISLVSFSIMYNVYLFTSIPDLNSASLGRDSYFKAMKIRGDYFVVSDFPYNYKDAFREAKYEGYGTSVLYMNGYAYLAGIMSSYTVSEIKTLKQHNDEIGLIVTTDTAKKINKAKDIQVVLFNGSYNNASSSLEILAKELRTLGWVDWKTFEDATFGNVVVGLTRN